MFNATNDNLAAQLVRVTNPNEDWNKATNRQNEMKRRDIMARRSRKCNTDLDEPVLLFSVQNCSHLFFTFSPNVKE